MKAAPWFFAVAACLTFVGCASSSPQAESYERLTQPTGTIATSSGNSPGTGPIGAALDVAETAVGAAAVPGYLDKPPPAPSDILDPNPEPYPR